MNLGTNRWAFKTELGLSAPGAPVTLDVATAVAFYTPNPDFGGRCLRQARILSVQPNLTTGFGKGAWAAVGTSYYCGGLRTVDGSSVGAAVGNARTGVTLSLPIDRRHSIRIKGSAGMSTRTSTDFDTVSSLM